MEGGANTTLDTCTDQTPCKLKLGGDADLERVGAVRAAAPNARLVVDANEAWSLAQLRELGPALAELGAELIEQPLPASEALRSRSSPGPVPLWADESVHDSATFEPLRSRYDLINVKLDKTGSLMEALGLAAARRAGMGIVVGCMVRTSLRRLAPDGFLRLRQSVPGPLTMTCVGAEANVAASVCQLGGRAVLVSALPEHAPADACVAAL